MKKLILFAICLLFVGCGGSGSGSSSSHNGEFELSGNIYNSFPSSKVSKAITFDSVTTITRLDYISISEMIQVDTFIVNNSLSDYSDLSVFIEIEDATFLTPESWKCNKWHERLDGNGAAGNEVWTEYQEPLSECTGEIKNPNIVCDENIYDCQNPSYIVDYTLPGDGLWKAQMAIPSLKVGEEFTNTAGYGNTGIDVRDDHQARWYITDNQGNILALKKYLFDVAL